MPVPQKFWCYDIEHIEDDATDDEILLLLNIAGSRGWEAFAVHPRGGGSIVFLRAEAVDEEEGRKRLRVLRENVDEAAGGR